MCTSESYAAMDIFMSIVGYSIVILLTAAVVVSAAISMILLFRLFIDMLKG